MQYGDGTQFGFSEPYGAGNLISLIGIFGMLVVPGLPPLPIYSSFVPSLAPIGDTAPALQYGSGIQYGDAIYGTPATIYIIDIAPAGGAFGMGLFGMGLFGVGSGFYPDLPAISPLYN
jgi:hypothetical protein